MRDPALRQAIELALAVARDGEAADPPVPAPARLRPYLSFARMPAAARDAAGRVIEDDATFRDRVAAAASPETVGEAGWLWLTRPAGWEDARAARAAVAAEMTAARHAEASELQGAKRAAAAAEAAARADAARRAAEAELQALRDELADARRQRRELQAALDAADADRARLAEERAGAVRQLKEVESQLAERGAEARGLRRELRVLANRLADVQAGAGPPSAEGATEPANDGATIDRHASASASELDRAGLARAVAAASAAAGQLSHALGAASALLWPMGGVPAGVTPANNLRPAGAGSVSSLPSVSPQSGRRRPLRMPPGVFEDTGEAVDFLCRAARVLLLVDGYNVSKSAWADQALAHQRQRLVETLVNLHARTGAEIEVVFDGVDDGNLGARVVPGPVRVRFTPAGLEADDMILSLVDHRVADQPIVVVSSDKRVRDGARRRGANTLPADLFLTVLR